MINKPELLGRIEIDLIKERMQGYQYWVDSLAIDVMKIALDLGHTLPRVDIVRTSGGVYQILYGRDPDLSNEGYGGHHRAIVYLTYNGGKNPLPCTLWSDHRLGDLEFREEGFSWRDLSEIRISRGGLISKLPTSTFIKSLAHLPRKEINLFLDKEGLDIREINRRCLFYFRVSFDKLCSNPKDF